MYRAGELAAIMAAYREAVVAKQQLENRKAFLEKRIPELEAELTGMTNKLAILERQRQEAINMRQSIVAALQGYRQRLAQISRELDAIQAQMRNLQAEILQVHRQIQACQQILKDPKYPRYIREETKKEMERLQGRLDELNSQLDGLQDIMAARLEEQRRLTQWAAQAEEAITRLGMEIEALFLQIEETEKQAEKVRQELEAARKELATLG
jgi:chromosome segregation ATPase